MAIDLVARSEWRARAPKGSYSSLHSTKGVKVHYTGGRVDPRIVDDHDRCVALVREIQDYHMDGNGWMDIGYSMVACPHRKVFVGRGPRHLPAANGPGQNSGHYAVLGLVGNKGLVEPTDGMLLGILDAIDYLRAHGGAGREIKGHQDGYPTDCPGGPLYAWIRKGAPRPKASPSKPAPEEEPIKITLVDGVPQWPGRVLRVTEPMMRGADVRIWQEKLAKRGWKIDVDGWYGPKSALVCRGYQRATGLSPTGKVDEQTWAMTWSWRPPAPCEPGMVDEAN
ncbi:peptidoglycan recognition protein family protein [Sphaerimonospora thailandensis]|uniref:Peptidoglycan recognition protein family domain-containing protein n=1 Tax=Sphaerimonospora thailandensis TaxID=795644 RepID=A0A8J3R9Q5_9ACTN|nr:N-acetylmuramoyl-L-alanine amidase [Sphaerimonospora thailandensis]GIH70356.1 hypothetical protein Mth01_26090 [Sphaerimonospora thailandensis]